MLFSQSLCLIFVAFIISVSSSQYPLQDPLAEEENLLEINEIIAPGLSGAKWKAALQELESKASDSALSPTTRAAASFVLGNFHAGILQVEEGYNPPVDLTKAFEYYVTATKTNHPSLASAQYMVSFILTYHPEAVPPIYRNFQGGEPSRLSDNHQTQHINDVSQQLPLKRNIPLALVYLQFAANGGSLSAQASLAYKQFHGHHTPVNCKKAVNLYQQVAYSQVQGMTFKPVIPVTGGNTLLSTEYSSSHDTLQEEEEIVYFHTYSAGNGNVESQIAISLIYLEGGIGGLARDHEKAFHYMHMAHNEHPDSAAAATYLAYYYAHGIGVDQDNATAVKLYEQAVNKGSAEAQTQLALMTLNGWGTFKNRKSGLQLLQGAAAENEEWALLNLGRYAFHGEHGITQHVGNAYAQFQKSAQQGNLVATYNLALISQHGMGVVHPACQVAVAYYKKIADRTILKRTLTQAFHHFIRGRYERALVAYELASDQGSMLGQQNAAWLYEMGFGLHLYGQHKSLDHDAQVDHKHEEHGPFMAIDRYQSAFRFYQLAAEQQSAAAHLKLGDFKYYGKGTEADIPMAAQYYKLGSEKGSPQATFNIGWMHQKGLGLPRDFHLAKRYYDSAMELSKEAYVPALLALMSLGVEYALDYLVVEGLIYGYKWDTVLLAALSVALAISLIARHYLVTAIHQDMAALHVPREEEDHVEHQEQDQ